jgi:anaerobic selenocysteine-containing dehydrogenase
VTTVTRTFCRLCEVGCGLVAHTDEQGALVELRPDHDHPATQGFACSNGLLAADVHRDPARLRRPQRRDGDTFVDVSWEHATEEIAARLRAIVDEDGPRSVGLYLGNPNAFNAMVPVGAFQFIRTLGSDRVFSSASQDCSNKYATAELLYGVAQANPIPDLERTELLLVIGANPRVSKTSFLSVADPIKALRGVRDRGGRVVFVNPLRIEPGIGETLQLRPDSDPYLLAAMLHEIDRTVGFELGALDADVVGIDDVREFVRPYSPAAVAPIVGIAADEIAAIARDFAAADGASVHCSTGLNMGRQGSLAYWLAQMLVLLTGNLDRAGGNFFAARGFPIAPTPVDRTEASFVQTKWGPYRPAVGMMPGALLADLIEDDEEPLRALVVVAGNPALSIGGSGRLQGALRSLDLLVSIDLYRNATGELADYVLPATDQYEREDLNTFVQGVQRTPYVQWTARVTEPDGQQREEWRFLADLMAALDYPVMLDSAVADPLPLVYDGPLARCGLSIEQLRSDGGVALLPEPGPGDSVAQLGLDAPLECVPDGLRSTLRRAHELFAELQSEPPDGFKLITRRTQHMLNSAFQNVEKLKARGADSNPLWIHPDDAERLGLGAEDLAEIANAHGTIRASVRFDANLRPGVVAMTHGFGNQATAGMPNAQAYPGVNVNLLGPSGAGSFDPVSGMLQLTGIPVAVVAVREQPTPAGPSR